MVSINRKAAKADKGPKIHSKESGVSIDYHKRPPIFCLTHVQKKHCIMDCQKDEKAKFAETLRALSQFTWQELYGLDHSGIGYESIKRLDKPHPKHLSPDVKFIAFRFSGNMAMIGHRVDDVFHILWFDRKFNVYDHGR